MIGDYGMSEVILSKRWITLVRDFTQGKPSGGRGDPPKGGLGLRQYIRYINSAHKHTHITLYSIPIFPSEAQNPLKFQRSSFTLSLTIPPCIISYPGGYFG